MYQQALVDDLLLAGSMALAGADERMSDATGVVDHVNRLGDAAEDWHQRQHAQEKPELVSVIDVADHISNGADVADDWGIGQRNLGDCPRDAEVQREVAE